MGSPSASRDRALPPDAELLSLAEKDAEAFGEFYLRHCTAVLRYFCGRTDGAHTAAELTAETFAAAWCARHAFRGEGSAEAWLFGIARHLLYRWLRRRAVDLRARRRLRMPPTSLDAGSIERIDELAASERARRHVREALGSLSPGLQDAVRLRIYDQLSYEEVAHRLDCSVGAARVRVARGLRQIEKMMEKTQ